MCVDEKTATTCFPLEQAADEGVPSDRASLKALRNILSEVDLILETCPPLPQNRTGRSRELLRAALALQGEARYSPAEIASTEVVPVMGRPDPERICTSIVERQNLTMRMQIRRLTRLTNAFSKKWENLWAALCLHFATTTCAASIAACGARRPWKQASRVTCGRSPSFSGYDLSVGGKLLGSARP